MNTVQNKQGMLRELRNFQGNKQLLELYEKNKRESCEEFQKQYYKDMLRVKSNVKCIYNLIANLPYEEREYIMDTFLENNISQSEILKKYNLSLSQFYYHCNKIAAQLVKFFNGSY